MGFWIHTIQAIGNEINLAKWIINVQVGYIMVTSTG